MLPRVGKTYGFDRPEIFSSTQVENPKFYSSRIASRHIVGAGGQMPYECETVDVDGLISRVLSMKNSGE